MINEVAYDLKADLPTVKDVGISVKAIESANAISELLQSGSIAFTWAPEVDAV